ncbi:MAG: RNA-binding S4 domain-containing protein [Gracilibacteraceae bacterium]|nr:RNA-binding S4 domain-containing protein [Gracilibacteraceae bacterium]
MRLDKYLKNSRLIKRRTIAKEACEGGKVYLNGKQAKPGAEVKPGDIIEIIFGEKRIKAEITDISDNVSKASAADMYRIIQG